MAIKNIDPSNKIYINETFVKYKEQSYHERIYFKIVDYKYRGTRLLYVNIDAILDIKSYLEGTNKTLFRIEMKEQDIPDLVKDAVADYQEILDNNYKS